jgi:hypothetical protein
VLALVYTGKPCVVLPYSANGGGDYEQNDELGAGSDPDAHEQRLVEVGDEMSDAPHTDRERRR